MIRKALIIYCSNTASGNLVGPTMDNLLYRKYLRSSLGGKWYDSEITSLPNPTNKKLIDTLESCYVNADYTFTIFTGHGFVDKNHNQYFEIADSNVPLTCVLNSSKRQTIIVDSYRGVESLAEALSDEFSEKQFTDVDTRKMFDNSVLGCEEGCTYMYSADINQSSSDSNEGGAYLSSLLSACLLWGSNNQNQSIYSLNQAHIDATKILKNRFPTSLQTPRIMPDKRKKYFPIAVKIPSCAFY